MTLPEHTTAVTLDPPCDCDRTLRSCLTRYINPIARVYAHCSRVIHTAFHSNLPHTPSRANMPLEVSQDQGESGISVKTTAAEGEKLPIDETAKVSFVSSRVYTVFRC